MAETADDILAHYGVVGMRWGHHNKASSDSGGGGTKSRAELKALNKQSKLNDRAERDIKIEEARQRYDTSARKNYLDAKAQYKIDKGTIGKREAAKKFNEVKQKNMDDYEVARQAKSGKETTKAVVAAVGLVALSVVLQGASRA